MASTICADPWARALHVQGIGDGHAVEMQLPAEQVAQNRGGQAGRQVVVLVG